MLAFFNSRRILRINSDEVLKFFYYYFIQHDITFENHLHGIKVFPNAHQHHGTENIYSKT